MNKYVALTLLIALGSVVCWYLIMLIDASFLGVSIFFIFLFSIIIALQVRIIDLLKRK